MHPVADAAEFNLEPIRVTTGSPNGASNALSLTNAGSWVYDDVANTVTLSGSFRADFGIGPAPTGSLFSHAMTDVVMELGATAIVISGAAYECIEGQFGGQVGANLCANTGFGGDFVDDTTVDYGTVPGTRVVGNDDVAVGPQQQLADYAAALNMFDGSMLVVESPAWTGNPGVAGIQLEFLVTSAPQLLDVPDVIGLEQSAAADALVALGLTVGSIAMANDPVVPAGQVISQNPLPCTECAMLNDPVNLVVSLGPLPVLTIPEQIDALADDVRALGLHFWFERFLVGVLRSAAAPLEKCNADAGEAQAQPRRWRRQSRRARICRNDGEDAAVRQLRFFAAIVDYLGRWKIPGDDADAIVARTNEIIDLLLIEPPTTGLYKITVDGVEREYFLRVPENYREYGAPQPIIFALHGATGTYFDWFEGGFQGDGLQQEVGDQAIMVFGQAAVGSGGITLWDPARDFAYFDNVLAEVRDRLLIDPNRVFVTGHSAGGGFTHQLGCNFGDVIRAIAPSSGALVARECIGSVAVMQMQSNQDRVTPIGIVQPSRDFWVAYNGFELDTFADGIVPPCVDYSLGASLYPAQWCEHSSTGANGHQWWDGADEAVWAFFSSLPTAVPTVEPPPGGGNGRVLEEFPATLSFTVRYPADINPVTLLAAVLYPAGTQQPILNAPLWFLNTDIPFAPATPGTVQSYDNVPIRIFEPSPGVPLPGPYTLSISVFVEGGSFPIPATGIDHIALYEVEIQDRFSPIIIDEVLDLIPVESF